MVHKELVLLGQVRSHRSLPKHITTDIPAALIDAEPHDSCKYARSCIRLDGATRACACVTAGGGVQDKYGGFVVGAVVICNVQLTTLH